MDGSGALSHGAVTVQGMDEHLTAAEMGDLAPEPTLFVADGLVRLSFSSIDTYRTCPAKFRYGYVFRVPTDETPTPFALGSAVHHALEKFHAGDLVRIPTEDDLKGWLREAWDMGPFDQFDDHVNANLKHRAWSAVTRYRRRVGEDWRPAAGTEVWFEVPFRDDDGVEQAMVVGSIDRLDRDDDGNWHVTDYKTNKKVKTRQHVSTDLQLSIYALAVEHLFGRLPATVALDFVVPGEVVRVAVDDLDLDAARRAVLDTARDVRDGKFDPVPNPLCDWCDFQAMCPAWQGEPGAHLGQAEQELRGLRKEARRLLKLVAEKQDALASLSIEVAEQANTQAEVLEVEADQRREERRQQREALTEQARQEPSPDDPSTPRLELDASVDP